MKKVLSMLIAILIILASVPISMAMVSDKTQQQFTNYNNDQVYELEESNYSISFNYVKNKGFNASAAFEAPAEMSVNEIEMLYVNEIYPDATLWLWNFESGLWIPIPLELNLIMDENDNSIMIEFAANWQDNMKIDRVTHADINTAIGEALQSSGEEWSASWLELAVGNWVEFNALYPSGSNRTQGTEPLPPYADMLIKPNTNYNNLDAYNLGDSGYAITFDYIKDKGFNVSASLSASGGMTIEQIEDQYINTVYPDATLWLWDYVKNLWIPIPLELKYLLDEFDSPVMIEFEASWQDNMQIDRVTQNDINSAIKDALQSNALVNGNDWSDCWLELAVGNWVEFNVLYPEK